jgi:hypothetical protein
MNFGIRVEGKRSKVKGQRKKVKGQRLKDSGKNLALVGYHTVHGECA